MEGRCVAVIDIGGLREVAVMAGISRQRAFQLSMKAWWPAPIAVLAAGHWRIYDLNEVRDALNAHGRNIV